jgi:hypothetical protein
VTFRRENAMGTRGTRTQRAAIAALLTRLRTKCCAAQCVMVAGTSLFSSLLARLMVRHRVGVTVTQTLSLTRVESDYFDLGTEA